MMQNLIYSLFETAGLSSVCQRTWGRDNFTKQTKFGQYQIAQNLYRSDCERFRCTVEKSFKDRFVCPYREFIGPQANDETTANSENCGGEGVAATNVATTVFIDDECSRAATYVTSTFKDDATIRLESIVDFMAKPVLVKQGTWATTDVSNTSLFSADIAPYLLSIVPWKNKIEGFTMVRGTAVIRLMMNCNPFQQGKLLLSFLPCYSDINASDASYGPMHNTTLASKRMNPCVEIDARETVCTIELPYIAPSNWCAQIGAGGSFHYDWGKFYITVFAPLRVGTGGQTDVEYAVYLSFKDFELSGPIVPQANPRGLSTSSMKQPPAAAEQNAMGGTVSSALSTVGKIASSASSIPFLSEIAGPAAWVANAASGVASYFGWSKPISNAPVNPISRQYNRYLATADGNDMAQPLAMKSDNSLSITDKVSYTDADEMSLAHLLVIPTMVQTINWAESQTSGTSLLSQLIAPTNLYYEGTTTHTKVTTWRVGPPVYYLSHLFALWRGSIDVIIKLAKTDYHSGRLQVTWTPIMFGGTPTLPTLTTSQLAMREIIDIRTGDEFCLNLPWYQFVNYLNPTQPSGRLNIVILNELRHPQTAADNVDLLVYYRAGKDFEYGAPTIWDSGTLPINPQGVDPRDLICAPIGGESYKSHTTNFAERSLGEQITSLKQFINRNNLILFSGGTMPGPGFYMYPWFSSSASLDGTTGVVLYPYQGNDSYSFISCMYAFFRGGMRVTFGPTGTSSTATTYSFPSYARASILPAGRAAFDTIATTSLITSINNVFTAPASVSAGVAISDGGPGLASFSVPYYAPTNMSFIFRQQNNTLTIPNTLDQPTHCLVAYNAAMTGTAATFYRSAMDDFQFSYFIGCPPVWVSTV